MRRRWVAAAAACLVAMLPAISGAEKDDRKAILDHIRGIFEAYIRADREAIRRAHSNDWTGFQGPSRRIERGIDDYMKNAEESLKAFKGVGYELLDSTVQIHGDVALVYYVARYDYRDGEQGAPTRSLFLRSLDVYERRDGAWIQTGSHIAPFPTGGRWGEGEDGS